MNEQNFEVSDYVENNVAKIEIELLPTYSKTFKIILSNSASSSKLILDLKTKWPVRYKKLDIKCLSHCNLEIQSISPLVSIQKINLENVSLIKKPNLTVENLVMQSFEAITTALPTVTKEAKITIKSSQDMLEVSKLLSGVNIIPATGEFVYDTKLQYKNNGQPVNMHNDNSVADSIYNLMSLKQSAPNLKWAAPVIAWLGTNKNNNDALDLNIKNINIMPSIDQIEDLATEKWKVAKYNKTNAYLVHKDKNNKVRYGGTTNDNSILRYTEALKNNGYKIMFYPMIFMDMPGKPWRGHLFAKNHSDVHEFFNKKLGYNRFIIHYAKLLKGKVDAFVIGSEMSALTQTVDNRYDQFDKRRYPAVLELINLAKQVKEILGSNVLITYAANWSEYHHDSIGFPHLDILWSSPFIDVVGIDAYLPITEKMKGEITVDDIKKGWRSGEFWEYVYEGSNRLPIAPEWGMKNIELWWKSEHKFKGVNSTWKPGMKPIWFTEFGFPSMHRSTNKPNIYFDADKRNNFSSKNSSSNPDFILQMRAIRSTLEYWKEKKDIVQNMFLWAWDVRPFPYFPTRLDLWSDGNNWSRGHWINGKLTPFKQVTLIDDIDVEFLHINAEELVIRDNFSSSKAKIDANNVTFIGNFYGNELLIKANSIHFISPIELNISGTLSLELFKNIKVSSSEDIKLSANRLKLIAPNTNIDISNVKNQNISQLLKS